MNRLEHLAGRLRWYVAHGWDQPGQLKRMLAAMNEAANALESVARDHQCSPQEVVSAQDAAAPDDVLAKERG